MPIEVVHDGTGRGDPMEHCAFCRGKTRYWHAAKDVAVCPACALERTAAEVPSKAKWIAKERELADEPRRASDFLSRLPSDH